MSDASRFASVSIIIPTFNRRELLQRAVEGYLQQSPNGCIREILVIDDGSTDRTEGAIHTLAERCPFPIRYYWQSNKGPAAARNIGIREAYSSLLLFTDSDIIPAHDLVHNHLTWHQEHPEMSFAMLGYVRWAADLPVTPFMKWYGKQKLFEFGKLRNEMEIDGRCLYTCNVSVKKEFLLGHGLFDEEFRTAAYEDTELGSRLRQHGLRLFFNQKAVGYHHQSFLFRQACSKARGNLEALQMFLTKDAGREQLEQFARKRRSTIRNLETKCARLLAAGLSPLRGLLDSPIPLPSQVYRLFFWESTNIEKLLEHSFFSQITAVPGKSCLGERTDFTAKP